MLQGKILITGDFDIPSHYDLNNFVHIKSPKDNEDIIKNLHDIQHYIVGGPEYIDESILCHAPMLKHIVVMGTGTNSFINIDAAKKREIRVENTPGINADAVSEFALGTIILSIANSFHSRDGLLTGKWYQKPHKSLSEIKLGVIGLGDIGTRLASKVRVISPKSEIYYFSRTRKETFENEFNIEFRPLLDLAKECDIVVLCVSYNNASHYIINRLFFNSAKKGIMLFNFSNPLVVDPIALSESLSSGSAEFAFFDGYYDEWVKNRGQEFDNYGLLKLGADKFIATSHIAALTTGVILKEIEEAITKVRAFYDS